MVFHMVVIIRVPRVPHERVRKVREQIVKQTDGKLLGEDTAHVDVLVAHERIGAHVPRLHDPVQEAMDPGEVVEEIHSAGNGRCEVENQMCEHYDVCRVAHYALGKGDVGDQERLECWWEVWQVPEEEYCGLKVRAFGVVERLQCCDCAFVRGCGVWTGCFECSICDPIWSSGNMSTDSSICPLLECSVGTSIAFLRMSNDWVK